MDAPPKSRAREVGGATLLLMLLLLVYVFFSAEVPKINALAPIFMGFCAPVAITCLGLFGVRSFQNNKPPP